MGRFFSRWGFCLYCKRTIIANFIHMKVSHKWLHWVWSNFYWREHIKQFIWDCEVCLQHKLEQLSHADLLQHLPYQIGYAWISQWTSLMIYLFLNKIYYICCCWFSMYSHFISIAHPYTAVSIAQVFFDNIFKLHGMPWTILNNSLDNSISVHPVSLRLTGKLR